MTKKHPNSNSNSDSKSAETGGFTVTITPYTVATFVVLIAAILFSWEQYRGPGDQALCEVAKGDYEDKTEWLTKIPDHVNKEEYLKYEQGTFVYRHIYMDDFEEVFGVKPIYFPVRFKHCFNDLTVNYCDLFADINYIR